MNINSSGDGSVEEQEMEPLNPGQEPLNAAQNGNVVNVNSSGEGRV